MRKHIVRAGKRSRRGVGIACIHLCAVHIDLDRFALHHIFGVKCRLRSLCRAVIGEFRLTPCNRKCPRRDRDDCAARNIIIVRLGDLVVNSLAACILECGCGIGVFSVLGLTVGHSCALGNRHSDRV